jgi:hypothetical protein
MDEGNRSNLSYIKPFSAVRQPSEGYLDFKQDRGGQDKQNFRQEQFRDDISEPKYDMNYERHRDRRERPEELQPSVEASSKHWYDEFPIADRRKHLEESIVERKREQERQEKMKLEEEHRIKEEMRIKEELEKYKDNQKYSKYENYDSKSYQKYTQQESSSQGFNHRKFENKNEVEGPKGEQYDPYFSLNEKNVFKSSQSEFKNERHNPKEQEYKKYDFQKEIKYSQDFSASKSPTFRGNGSPRFERSNFDDITNQNKSRSYNRSNGIHKRTFINPKSNKEEFHITDVSQDERNIGKSASHGFERHFKGKSPPSYNQNYNRKESTSTIELKFNKKSANYDMSEIELPAYCKTHPDGKLLYVITPEGHESELGCAHCALNINKTDIRCSIVEVKQKLDDYIHNASQHLHTGKTSHTQVDPQLVSKVKACRDKEIAMIRQYYDKVMSAIKDERDRQISEISEIADNNVSQISQPKYSQKSQKGTKIDAKLNNFCIELGKVVEGVDDTGIHIKELWKINQDYKDVVSQKVKEAETQPANNNIQLSSFEFHSAPDESLKSLSNKLGEVVQKKVSSDYFLSNSSEYQYKATSYSRNYSNSQYDNKIEQIPTFGTLVGDESKKYDNYKNQNHNYTNSGYKDYKSVSPVRQNKLNYEASSTNINKELKQTLDFNPMDSNSKDLEYVPRSYKHEDSSKNGSEFEQRNYQQTEKYSNYQKYEHKQDYSKYEQESKTDNRRGEPSKYDENRETWKYQHSSQTQDRQMHEPLRSSHEASRQTHEPERKMHEPERKIHEPERKTHDYSRPTHEKYEFSKHERHQSERQEQQRFSHSDRNNPNEQSDTKYA